MESKPRWQSWLSVLILIPMIILVVTRAIPIIFAASFAVFILLVTQTISREQARRSVDLRVLVIIAASFGIADAIQTSGLADFIAKGIINITLKKVVPDGCSRTITRHLKVQGGK